MVALAHHDPSAYRGRFELVHRRESAHQNNLWQADHTELDVMITDEACRAVRPWWTVIPDDHSRAVTGYAVLLGDPSSLQTALALRLAIWRKTDPGWPVCGLPAAHYSDYGADFTSNHMTQVCVTTELIPTLPGHIPPGNNGRAVTAPVISLSELDSALGRFIIVDYHHRAHQETGQPPIQRGESRSRLAS